MSSVSTSSTPLHPPGRSTSGSRQMSDAAVAARSAHPSRAAPDEQGLLLFPDCDGLQHVGVVAKIGVTRRKLVYLQNVSNNVGRLLAIQRARSVLRHRLLSLVDQLRER